MAQSLRRVLIVPYALLVLALALIIGLSSYQSGVRAVETILKNQLVEKVRRIGAVVDRNVALARVTLDVAFPHGMPPPASFEQDIPELRGRFWLATGLDIENYNNVYYGSRDGHLVGVQRKSATVGSLRIVDKLGAVGRSALFTGPVGEPGEFAPDYPTNVLQRPWFRAATNGPVDVWSPIYIDARTNELVGTRSRPVLAGDGKLAGVVATDISLRNLNEQLLSVRMTSHGLAFVMETDGTLIASTASPYLRKTGAGPMRLTAADSGNPLVKALSARVLGVLAARESVELPQTFVLDGIDDGVVFAAFTRVVDEAGLNWIVVAAGPRADFMQDVSRDLIQTGAIALVAVAFAIVIGFVIFDWVSRDLHRIAVAAHKVGEGDLDAQVGVQRGDEIGELARSFEAMQTRLRTDRLTRIANRETLVRRVDGEATRRLRSASQKPFGVFFIDVNRFKQINDEHGHEAGDKVLIEIARRLSMTMRPSDLVARYAGDEFVVFIEEAPDREALDLVRSRIEAAMAAPMELEGVGILHCSVSVGIATFPADGHDVDNLLARADEEMYRRKFASR
jgi:diguanylate cyclase (GGDEF)-like protein